MNKKAIVILVIVLVAIVGIVYFVINKQALLPDEAGVDQNAGLSPLSSKNEICYFGETNGEEGKDSTFVSVNYDGDKVNGVINFIPGERESLVGTYMGTVERSEIPPYQNRLNVLYTAIGEGVTSKQQEVILVNEKDLMMGTGEKYQDKDGVYKYRNATNLTYDKVVPMVSCAGVAERFKKDYSKTN